MTRRIFAFDEGADLARSLPPGFRWGVATAAYQIEGAVDEDGRGTSIWDTFSHEPGRTRDGHTGDVACDHYHRWPEDVRLMAGLGVHDYRFSVAWPRIQPTGAGPVNAAGLDFYDRLTDGLLEHGITPNPTLYHWDLPQPLEDRGGWLNRDTAHRFAEYADAVAERLADRVGMWMTLNEPVVVMAYGYAFGLHAPGRALVLDALPTAHHQLLAHGLAVGALRARGARRIAIANHYIPAWPAGETAGDIAAAEAFDILINRLFTEPILLGRYPDLSALGAAGALAAGHGAGPADPGDLPVVRDGDLDVISAPIDALGVNYYQPNLLAAAPEGPLPFDIRPVEGRPTTGTGWPVVPEALRDLLLDLRRRYGGALPPVHITENGCSYDERLDDADRVAFLDAHLRAVREAIDEGVDVRGYYVWSLMDNFEWAEGYHPRFGLVHIDYATQRRTPRASYAWYRDLIAAHRAR
ncbi:GH1 family beta-glucosidase [Actinomadura sp. HBU206391]|uniref:GH1 family beta-glucosidase n=1 Tax=Actinomadura sp. HBU206391 TaxID=2731692 RepID=UPI0039671DDE